MRVPHHLAWSDDRALDLAVGILMLPCKAHCTFRPLCQDLSYECPWLRTASTQETSARVPTDDCLFL